MGTPERYYIAHTTIVNVSVDGCEHLAAWCFDAPDSKPGTRAAQVRDCLNALRGLDVAKVEALLDAVRAEAALPNHAISAYNDSIRATERAISALADSIRAGGGQ